MHCDIQLLVLGCAFTLYNIRTYRCVQSAATGSSCTFLRGGCVVIVIRKGRDKSRPRPVQACSISLQQDGGAINRAPTKRHPEGRKPHAACF